MAFPLTQITDDQLKHLQWFVLGALHEHNKDLGNLFDTAFNSYYQDTLNKIVRYLKGQQDADASFSDFQCRMALEAQKLFNPKPVGYVTAGDIQFTKPGQIPPNLGRVENEAGAWYWMEECHLRVLPLYVGEPLNKID